LVFDIIERHIIVHTFVTDSELFYEGV